MPAFRKILIIQTAFIGDAILASSLVEKMHHCFPEARISILVRKGNEGIYKGHPYLQETLVWNKQKAKLKNLFSLLGLIRKNKYDCVINCHRYASSGLLAGFSGSAHISGFKQNPFSFLFNHTVKHIIGDGRHETERYNELVEDFSGKEIFKPKLYPDSNDEKVAAQYLTTPYICIAPASVWHTKQLPVSKWVELCNKMPPSLRIYLLGAPSDSPTCEAIIKESKHIEIISLAGKLSLLQSCALMRQARMNYVNDSAPLHLASSVNAPVTAFFLSTIPAFGFGPLSDNSIIAEVQGLGCRPCGIRGFNHCPKQHFNCANKLELPALSF